MSVRTTATTDVARILGDHGDQVAIKSPEGVLLRFRVAAMGMRLGAFVLDLLIIFLAMFLVGIALVMIFDLAGLTLWMLLWFLVVNFYFPFCEYRWGATIGKRSVGIRVIDRRGAPLALEGILARNIMRDLEFWLPFMIWVTGGRALFGLPIWAVPLAFLWSLLMGFFPLFSRQRLRIGDYVGGTMVVEVPKPQLLRDLAQKDPQEGVLFSPQQLAVYGRVELQVLEDLLRRPPKLARPAIRKVAKKIKRRIGWSDEDRRIEDRDFLQAFYRAQREELERLMALGKARDRRAQRDGPPG